MRVVEFTFATLFLLSFTQTDRLLGRVGLLPVGPVWLFLLVGVPLAGCAVAWDLSAPRNGRQILGLIAGALPVIVPFAALVAVALLWSLHPTANWSEGGHHILLLPFDFAVFSLSLLIGNLVIIRARLSQLGIMAGSLLAVTVVADVISPGLFSNQMSRAAGVAENSNLAAFLTLSAACLALSYGRSLSRDLAVFGLTGLAVLMTFSRTGMLLYLALLLVYLIILGLFRPRSSSRRIWVPVAFVFMVLALGLGVARLLVSLEVGVFSRSVARQRVGMLTDLESFVEDDDDRLGLVRSYGELIATAPLAGHGTGYSYGLVWGPHNRFLQAWTNLGFPGFLAYCGLLLGALALFVSYRWSPGLAYLAILAGWSFFSHGVLEQRSVPMMLGLLTAAAVCERRSKAAGGERLPQG